jgi:ribosomal protein S18
MRMQKEKPLLPQEAMMLHELLRNEITDYKKLRMSVLAVEDGELKEFMKESIDFKKEHIEQLQQFISAQGKMQ